MDLSLKGKNAAVAGATRGIGRAISEAFAREGAQVLILDINAAAAQEMADEIGADAATAAEQAAAENFKRVRRFDDVDWSSDASASPWHIEAFQEIKTTWHPVAN